MKKTKIVKNDLCDKLIWILTVSMLSCFFLLDLNSLGSLMAAIFAGSIFLLSLIRTNGKIRFNFGKFHVYVVAFGSFCLLSSIWARDYTLSFIATITIFEILICMSLIYIYYSQKESIDEMIQAIMWAGLVVSIYYLTSNDLMSLTSLSSVTVRLGTDVTNVNYIAVLGALSIEIAVFYLLYRGFKWYFPIIVIPCFLMIAVSGCRKAIIDVVAGIFIIIYRKYQGKNFLTTFVKVLIAGVAFVGLIWAVSLIPVFSIVNDRMVSMFNYITGAGDVDSSTLARAYLIEIGMNQFKKTPLFGIGIGNPRLLALEYWGHNCYLHNNFVELLAGVGLTGFIVYYSAHFYFLKNFLKNWKSRNEYFAIALAITISLLLTDYGEVSYYMKITYFYFMVLFIFFDKIQNSPSQESENRMEVAK